MFTAVNDLFTSVAKESLEKVTLPTSGEKLQL